VDTALYSTVTDSGQDVSDSMIFSVNYYRDNWLQYWCSEPYTELCYFCQLAVVCRMATAKKLHR
jgi:hypothetical protein